MQWDQSTQAQQTSMSAMHEPQFSTSFSSSTFTDESLETIPNMIDSYSPLINDSPESWNSSHSKDNWAPFNFDFEPRTAPPTPNSSKHSSIAGLRISLPPSLHNANASYFDEALHSAPIGWKMEPQHSQHSIHSIHSQPDLTPTTPVSMGSRSKRTSRNLEDEQGNQGTQGTEKQNKRASGIKTHARGQSLNENGPMGGRTAKLAHNIVERNYRDRLNDQITELSSYLFDLSAESKCKKSFSPHLSTPIPMLLQSIPSYSETSSASS
jgi:hypothetical protein